MNKPSQFGFSRRSFLLGAAGAGVAVGFYLNRRSDETLVAKSDASAEPVNVEWEPQAFVHIGTDNRVTVLSKHTEMGQGIYTGLATIVAEELDAAWEQMRVESAPADTARYLNLDWGEQATGGSSSLGNSFAQLRQVGAAMRAMLQAAAANHWGVDPTGVSIDNGVVRQEANNETLTFGQLASSAAALPVPGSVTLKPVESYRFADQNVRRVDVEPKTTGRASFTQDVVLPGMQIAVVAHAPRFGGRVVSFDDAAARSIAGVETVVEIPSGVAVIADSFWTAQKARNLLSIDWDESEAFKLSSNDIIERFRKIAKTTGAVARDEGSVSDGFESSARIVDAEFDYPLLAHAPIEPQNCAVRWSGDKCEIWSGTQQQTTDQNDAASILGIPPENVEIHTLLAGGGFGRRASTDYAREAIHIAKARGPSDSPVKLVWTREDDMKAGKYRPLNFHQLRAGIDADGSIVAWQHCLVGQSIAGQVAPHWIANGVDGMSVNGADDWLYNIPNVRVETHSPELPIPVLWYRGVSATHTVYSVETFVDELAAAADREPLEYRLSMLSDHPRMAEVANRAAELADWGTPLEPDRGRGIAICRLRGTYLGQVAEVTVEDDGSYTVDRVVTAVDCGLPLNPDNIRAQVEGGTGFGLSSVLVDAITLRDGYVEQDNFDAYPLLRINQMPSVDVHIVSSTEPPSGIGELAPMAVGAAVANALSSVNGKRYRSLPIRSA